MTYDEAEMTATLKGAGFSDEYIARYRGDSSTTRKNKSRTELKELMRAEMKAIGRIDMVAIKEHPLFTDRRLTNRLIKQICAEEKWEYEAVKQGKTLIAYRRKMDLSEAVSDLLTRLKPAGPGRVAGTENIADLCVEYSTNPQAIVDQADGQLRLTKDDYVVERVK